MDEKHAVELAKVADRIARNACQTMRDETKIHAPDNPADQAILASIAAGIMVGALRQAFGSDTSHDVQTLFLAGILQGTADYRKVKEGMAHGTKP